MCPRLLRGNGQEHLKIEVPGSRKSSVLTRCRSSRLFQPSHARSRSKREATRFKEPHQPKPRINREARSAKTKSSSGKREATRFRGLHQAKPHLNRKALQSPSRSSRSKGPLKEQHQLTLRRSRKTLQSMSRSRSQRGDTDRRRTARHATNKVTILGGTGATLLTVGLPTPTADLD